MKPIDFAESNRTLMPPSGMNNCKELRVFTDGNECISKWKLTFKERIAILFGAPVWMGMRSGTTQPPVFLNVEYPFVNRHSKNQSPQPFIRSCSVTNPQLTLTRWKRRSQNNRMTSWQR